MVVRVSTADAYDRGATTFNAPPSRSHSSISHVRNESKSRASAARTNKRDTQPSIGCHPYLSGQVGGERGPQRRGKEASGAAASAAESGARQMVPVHGVLGSLVSHVISWTEPLLVVNPNCHTSLADSKAVAVALMRYCCLAGVDVALLLLAGAARSRSGEAFLFAGLRVPSTPRQQHDPSSSSNTHQQQAVASRLLLPTTSRPPSTTSTLRVTPADDATGQQILEYPSMAGDQEGGAPEGREEGAAQPPPIPKDTTRTGVALDGTALAFRPPTTEDLHKLGMGDWVAQKGLAVALVALDATEQAAGEPVIGAPLAGAVVEAMGDGMVGGSSVATRVCLLRHRREDGVAEAVEHALLDETINRFLNDGARISQVGAVE